MPKNVKAKIIKILIFVIVAIGWYGILVPYLVSVNSDIPVFLGIFLAVVYPVVALFYVFDKEIAGIIKFIKESL